MEKRVVGVYENEGQAHDAVEELKRKGYRLEDISIVAKNIEELGPNVEQVQPKNADGMIAGATAGGVIGLTGLLVGMSTLAIPGIGPIVAAGPIFSMLGGAVAGAATNAGGLTGALKEMGLPEEEARQYEGDVKDGKILVLVDGKHVDSSEFK
ncbi:general stress protein [Peribacillus glennii]|uniref:General stress protein n=1 Tax=Peribacillus glennii TaxID=2303991 RepID=A0A372LG20_9BACI|nr:general stress protein [Peribacillus glennii]RFU65019.1 general stress protein [Peribacillus glennii]